MSAFFY
jgi:hypothetical protein